MLLLGTKHPLGLGRHDYLLGSRRSSYLTALLSDRKAHLHAASNSRAEVIASLNN